MNDRRSTLTRAVTSPAYANGRSQPAIAVALACATCVVLSAESRESEQSARLLSDLRSRSGWILLGALDASSNRWASLLKHMTSRSRDGVPHMPEEGDVIEVTGPLEVYILEYELRGEERLLGPPVGKVRAPRDFTGVSLTAGTKVRVKRVERGQRTGSLQSVWALVSPS